MKTNVFDRLPRDLELMGKLIVDSAYTVHRNLGPSLLEKVYEACFCYELKKRNLKFLRQVDIPVVYDDMVFKEGLRIDVIVEDKIICEIKAMDNINPVWEAQILSQMKMTGKRLGYLINFHVPIMKQGIRRYII